MTNYIIGKRCSGKTTRLIKRSAKEGKYILTATKLMARCIADQAKDMGLDIPFPVTVDEYLRGNKFRGSSIRRDGLLIDDLELVLQTLFSGIPIHEVTLTDRGNVERLEIRTKPLDYELDPYRFHDLTDDSSDLPDKCGLDRVMVKIEYPGIPDDYFDPIIAEYRNGKWYKDDTCLNDFCIVRGWFKIYDPTIKE